MSIGVARVRRRNATILRAENGRYGCRFDALLTPNALHAASASDQVVDGMFDAPLPAGASPEAGSTSGIRPRA